MDMWTVSLKLASSSGAPEVDGETCASLLNKLSGRCAILTTGEDYCSLTFDVCASNFLAAASKAQELADDALLAAALPSMEVTEANVINHVERDKDLVGLPDLVGVAEVARYLNVRKQRVSQLAKTRAFPAPVAILSATPIWKKSDVVSFAARRRRAAKGPNKPSLTRTKSR